MEHLSREHINTNDVNNIINIRSSLACGALAPALHNQLPLTTIPSWKLYENPFYGDGQLVPKYVPRYLNPPLCRAANSFTTAAKGAANSLTLAANSLITPANCGAHPPPASPLISARKLAASFWEHHEIHRLAQAEEPAMPSDLVNVQAQQPNLPPSETLKCPSLHLDCKISHASTEDKTDPGEAINMASNQATLANILHRVRFVEENQSRSMAMVAKLRLEMEDASSRIQELEFSHKSALREINSLLQRFGEQMTISRRKEQEKVKVAFLHLREEMEEERSACRLLKIQNKKMAKDLTEANTAAADACEELDREKKARELIEEVCNELAREIGEDKAEVEQLKQEQAKSRERVEEELKILRLAALWQEKGVRGEQSEAQLELFDGKQYMSLQDLKSKLEAFVSTVAGVTCEGSQEDIENQVEQAKMLRRALEVLQLDEGEVQDKAEEVGLPIQHTSTGCSHACGNQNDGETMNYLEQIMPSKTSKKLRKVRLRSRASADHRYNVSIRQQKVYDQRNTGFLEVHENRDNEVQRKQFTLHGVKNIGDDHIHVHSTSPEEDDSNKIWRKQGPSVCDTSEQIKEKSNLEQSSSLKGVHRKHLSLHFDVEGGEDHQLDDTMGPSNLHHSYSEDDANYINVGRGERQRKQKALDAMSTRASITKHEEGMHQWRYHAGHDEEIRDDDDDDESAGGEGGEDSELIDFYFEPVRAPFNSLVNKNISYVDDHPVKVERRDFSSSSSDQARITAKTTTQSPNMVSKIHENADGTMTTTTARSSQELLIKGAAKSSRQEPMKMVAPANSFHQSQSPRRSASAKPLHCFWPPSPDAFSIFAGANKRSKAAISSGQAQMEIHSRIKASNVMQQEGDHEQQYEQLQQVNTINMKGNSLRAELLKARELENEKPAKSSSFRFSPLRRSDTTSSG